MVMAKSPEEFQKELLADFLLEATEHLQAIVDGLLILEKNPGTSVAQGHLENIFRDVHSLKGASRAVNLPAIERVCQTIESVFHAVRQGSLTLTAPAFEILFQSVDLLQTMVAGIGSASPNSAETDVLPMVRRLETIISEPRRVVLPPIPERHKDNPREKDAVKKEELPAIPQVEPRIARDTVRVPVIKLDHLLLGAEEFLTLKSVLRYQINELGTIAELHDGKMIREFENIYRQMSRMVDELLINIRQTLLLPFSDILGTVPRLVRDLGKEFGKEIVLTVKGAEIEIDRRILEELKDPMIHLIRNCVDHGIEPVAQRLQAGKGSEGNLSITIAQEPGNKVILKICDDGAGISTGALLKSAIKAGVVSGDEAAEMSREEILPLIFKSGISTSPFITDISGRGLGMAIVASKVNLLGGDIRVTSQAGIGTSFEISLPVTLATFRGVMVRTGTSYFLMPVGVVKSAVRIPKDEVRTAKGKSFIYHHGENLAVARLSDVLGTKESRGTEKDVKMLQLLVVHLARKNFGLLVEEISGEEEGIIKGLGNQLVHVKHISGALILGNGIIVPILNPEEIGETLLQTSASPVILAGESDTEPEQRPPVKILIAEDSITLRSLLRNIIESEGYEVGTAVDGLDAYQKLVDGGYNLLVSDVEMPRMNGFVLTEKVRDDNRLADLPVILVTALDSPVDRQRGMEVGADAYIVKGNFEQSNLLDTIKRLI